MVSANLSYRNHVPSDYIALECSSLDFNGDNFTATSLLGQLSSLIRNEKSNEHKIRIEKLRKHRQTNYTEWLEWQKEIKSFKREHLLWMLSRELREEMSILKAECDKLGANDEHLSLAISQLEDSRFYDASELTKKFKQLLAGLGFTCKTATRNESGLHEEIYESTCSDEKLIERVRNMYIRLETEQKKKQLDLSERYSQSDIIDSREIFYMD